jgi:hypothetical protein
VLSQLRRGTRGYGYYDHHASRFWVRAVNDAETAAVCLSDAGEPTQHMRRRQDIEAEIVLDDALAHRLLVTKEPRDAFLARMVNRMMASSSAGTTDLQGVVVKREIYSRVLEGLRAWVQRYVTSQVPTPPPLETLTAVD